MTTRPSKQLEADATAVNILIGGLTGQPEVPHMMRRRFSDEEVMVVRGGYGIHQYHHRTGDAHEGTRGRTDPKVSRTAI